jgi:hypothetical protein
MSLPCLALLGVPFPFGCVLAWFLSSRRARALAVQMRMVGVIDLGLGGGFAMRATGGALGNAAPAFVF